MKRAADKLRAYWRGSAMFRAGSVITVLMLLFVLIGAIHTPYPPSAMNEGAKLAGFSPAHLLGTDHLGRDMLSRLMTGAGTTLLIALGTVAIGAFFGSLIGALCGYFGRLLDETLMRLMDALFAFPSILLALLFVSLFGSGRYHVIIALGIAFVPSFARTVRGEFLRERGKDYVTGARLHGVSHLRIVFMHILPNAGDVLLSAVLIGFNNAVLAEAGLSFLGIGVQPPDASLGRMLSESQQYLFKAPMSALLPGFFLVLMILGFSLAGEGIRSEDNHKGTGVKTDPQPAHGSIANEKESAAEKDTAGSGSREKRVPLLTVENLQIDFHDHQTPETAVYDFDLTVMPGEIVGIVGESGAGKSLSALAVAGLLKRHSEIREGSIHFEDEDLLHCGREILRSYQGDEIAVIFQEPMSSLNPLVRVGMQVEESLRVHHPEIGREERRRRALEAIRSVGMNDAERVYECYPHELSGGMRQRAMIAAAMIAEPRILIADEPTTALDVTVQAQIIDLLRQINREKRTAILFISHDLSLVKQLCERVLVMKDGRVVEEGETERVFEQPSHAYTRELIAAIPRIGPKEETGAFGDALLEVSHLNAGYGKHLMQENRILHDISFSLRAGEILGLAGESGSGKSTLAKAVLGLLTAVDGNVEKHDFRAAMVFQDPYGSLNPAHTIGWILTEALTKGKRHAFSDEEELRTRAAEALAQVELPENFLDRRPSELSGGQRQRVAIAEALIGRPSVIIADEPVSALDVTVQAQIIALLEKLRRETGVAILLIAHDLRVIYKVCDRVLIMKKGRIVEQGDVEKIYFHPQEEYTRELLISAGIANAQRPDDK